MPKGNAQKRHRLWRPSIAILLIGGAVLLVAAAGLGTGMLGSLSQSVPDPAPNAAVAWPKYVTSAPAAAREAYRFALENPGALQYVPCYCGCRAAGHTNNEQCFIADRTGKQVAFDPHGAG